MAAVALPYGILKDGLLTDFPDVVVK